MARRSGCFLARGFGGAVDFRVRAVLFGGSAGWGAWSWSAVTGVFGAGRVPVFARPVEALRGAEVFFFFSSDISMANPILPAMSLAGRQSFSRGFVWNERNSRQCRRAASLVQTATSQNQVWSAALARVVFRSGELCGWNLRANNHQV
jgi:hypothetical protein